MIAEQSALVLRGSAQQQDKHAEITLGATIFDRLLYFNDKPNVMITNELFVVTGSNT